MKSRLPTALSVTALIVALLGATGVANAVVVSFAANAGKLSGFKASKKAKKNTVVVRGANGKIDARSIPTQARGPQGPQGPKGEPGALGGPAGGSLTGTYPNPSLAPGSVGTNQISNGAVDWTKVADETLGTAQVADNSLTGADISEPTLAEVPSALVGGFGRFASNDSFCDPSTLTLVICASLNVSLPAQARVLVIGHAYAYVYPAGPGAGTCELGSSVLDLPDTHTLFSLDPPNIDNGTLVGITPPLGPGTVQFRIRCNESSGDIGYSRFRIAVVALSLS